MSHFTAPELEQLNEQFIAAQKRVWAADRELRAAARALVDAEVALAIGKVMKDLNDNPLKAQQLERRVDPGFQVGPG